MMLLSLLDKADRRSISQPERCFEMDGSLSGEEI
jgi:hypothetical protein